MLLSVSVKFMSNSHSFTYSQRSMCVAWNIYICEYIHKFGSFMLFFFFSNSVCLLSTFRFFFSLLAYLVNATTLSCKHSIELLNRKMDKKNPNSMMKENVHTNSYVYTRSTCKCRECIVKNQSSFQRFCRSALIIRGRYWSEGKKLKSHNRFVWPLFV